VFFPGGASGKRFPIYVTGGVGAVALHSRTPTGQFGYDPNTIGFETFMAENVGGGLKIFRGGDAPEWGFRIDYRYVIVNSNSDAPAFFAKAKNRAGHRVSSASCIRGSVRAPHISRRTGWGSCGSGSPLECVRYTGFERQGDGRQRAPQFMYVGSFTAKDGGRGEGLSVYQRNLKTQTWTLVQLLKDIADPSFLILDRARRHLYSAHGDGTQVTAYNVDETSGRLTV
jgi:hypothetical protein